VPYRHGETELRRYQLFEDIAVTQPDRSGWVGNVRYADAPHSDLKSDMSWHWENYRRFSGASNWVMASILALGAIRPEYGLRDDHLVAIKCRCRRTIKLKPQIKGLGNTLAERRIICARQQPISW
jgi:hypothetical protein